eukprot:PhF_6_TR17301/c0_g1_i1/m.26519
MVDHPTKTQRPLLHGHIRCFSFAFQYPPSMGRVRRTTTKAHGDPSAYASSVFMGWLAMAITNSTTCPDSLSSGDNRNRHESSRKRNYKSRLSTRKFISSLGNIF